MNRDAHADAPLLDRTSRRLYDMVLEQAPFRDVLKFLLEDFNGAARVAALPAYIQPNGFYTFKLGGVDGDNVLRLHFWPEGRPDQYKAGGIHDHVFSFTSLVLSGDRPMINTHYEIEEDRESPLAVYKVIYTSARDSQIVKLADHFRPVAAARDIVPAGQYYTFPAGRFHTSQIMDNGEAFTLMATRLDPRFDGPRFIAPSAYSAELTSYTRRDPSPEQRALVARKLADLKP